MLKEIINQDEESTSAESSAESGIDSKGGTSKSATKGRGGFASTSLGSGRNILSSDVQIRGKLRFTEELTIDGRIEGEVNSEGDLTVGENAHIVGNINTRSVVVYGKVHGNITVEDRCELKRNAELHGDVSAGKLAVEEGASFLGSSAVGGSATKPASGEGDPK